MTISYASLTLFKGRLYSELEIYQGQEILFHCFIFILFSIHSRTLFLRDPAVMGYIIDDRCPPMIIIHELYID